VLHRHIGAFGQQRCHIGMGTTGHHALNTAGVWLGQQQAIGIEQWTGGGVKPQQGGSVSFHGRAA
jgi:hypothetical protein